MGEVKFEQALLIGAGAVAIEFHLPRLLAILGVERVRVVESSASRRSDLGRRFRRDARIEIAEAPDSDRSFDLAIIATPPRFHADYFHAVAGQARGVVIEKPVTIDVGKALGIRDSLSAGGPCLWVNLIRRCLSSFGLLREFWRQGRFGALESVELHEGRVYAWEATSLGSFSKELNGGGVLMDTGPHVLDLLVQVFDEVALEDAFVDGVETGIEANATLLLRGDGVPITVQMSRNRNLSNTATFHFEQAVCRVGVCSDQIHVIPHDGTPHLVRAGSPVVPEPSFADLFDRFYVDKLKAWDATGVGIDESLASLRILEEAYSIAQPIRGGF